MLLPMLLQWACAALHPLAYVPAAPSAFDAQPGVQHLLHMGNGYMTTLASLATLLPLLHALITALPWAGAAPPTPIALVCD